MTHHKYLIVGAGITADAAVQGIHELDPKVTCPPNPGPICKLGNSQEKKIYSGRTGEECQGKSFQLNRSSANYAKEKFCLAKVKLFRPSARAFG
jgi:hypothetical protein